MSSSVRGQLVIEDVCLGRHDRVTHLDNPATMRTFDVTPDGRQIVFDRQRDNADLVLIDLPKDK